MILFSPSREGKKSATDVQEHKMTTDWNSCFSDDDVIIRKEKLRLPVFNFLPDG